MLRTTARTVIASPGRGALGAAIVTKRRAILQFGTAAHKEPLDVRSDERRLIGNERGLEDELGAVFDRIVDAEDST